jgi:CelD/BcsL family acetyltransferase involved in cellulose biosynthesis
MAPENVVAELVDPDRPVWTEVLATVPHDIYHLPGYVRLAARWQEPGQPVAFIAQEPGGRMLLPLIVRPIPTEIAEDAFDVTSSRLFPGPVLAVDEGQPSDGFAGRAVASFVDGMRRRGVVSAFVRLHPLLPPPLDALRRIGTVVEHGETVSIDLTRSPEALWNQIRANHRRDIVRATRQGYAARIDAHWERLDDFVEAYRQSMDRVGATPAWRFPAAYFTDLRAAAPGHVHLCVVELDDELASAAILTEVDGIVEYHLAGTADRHVALSPSKLLIDFARRWAAERGNRRLHLAGSLRRGDPLHHFKLGFSPETHPMLSWRVVTEPAAYSRLVERWEQTSGECADGPHAYFPAYRRPMPLPTSVPSPA